MRKIRYTEKYRAHNILIHGISREWLWQVVINGRAVNASTYYFSSQAAIKAAQKYIDKKTI